MSKKNEYQGHLIREVYPDSIAEAMEIEPGDVLLRINNQKIEDVFDYRYMIKDEYVEVLIRKPDGEEWLLEIEKEYDDDLGVEFENGLMSDYRSCSNKCIFFFIDQMPPGMRETLYFKDDDSRLSFLQGNYITLTNMKQKDVDRIIEMQLAPINISVQTTNPELRCKMLHNRFAGEKLKFLDDLYAGHVEMNGQIVLCKGVNDKDELKRSIEDLMKYLPFMRSVSVVPAGLSKYREGLYPLELFDVVSSDEDLDLMGIIIVGTPDDNTDKLLVGTRAAVWAEAMRADGVILSSDGWGNSDVDFANTAEQMEIRGIPVTGLKFSGTVGQFVVENDHLGEILDINKSEEGIETDVLGENNVTELDAKKVTAMLKLKMRKNEKR